MLYVVIMSIAGSSFVACYFLAERLKADFFSPRIKCLLLRLAVFFYLVPLFGVEYFYKEAVYCVPVSSATEKKFIEQSAGRMPFIRYEGELHGNYEYDMLMLSFIVWFGVALLFLGIGIFRYFIKKRQIHSMYRPVTDKECLLQLSEIKKEYGIRKIIRLYDCGENGIPFTTGFMKPIVFIHAAQDASLRNMVLRHELMHIKRNDLLLKQLAALTNYVHWFNPFAYLLRRYFEDVCELVCDEKVASDIKESQRAEYARLIVQNMTKTVSSENDIIAAFGNGLCNNSTKKAEKRIRTIMDRKKRTRWQRVMAGLFVAVMVFANTLTVFAYPQIAVERGNDLGQVYGSHVESYFYPDGYEGETLLMEVYPVCYEVEFIDENGNVYEVEALDESGNIYVVISGDAVPSEVHTHHFVTGRLQEHVMNASGGCTSYVYEAQKCRCGLVVKGDLISYNTYITCPH